MVKATGQVGLKREEVIQGLLRFHSLYCFAPLSGEIYQAKIKSDKSSRLYNLPNYRQVLNHFRTLVEGWRAAGVTPDYPKCVECGDLREVYKVRSDLCKKCSNRAYRSSRKKSALEQWQITDEIRERLENAYAEGGDGRSVRVALNWLSQDSGIPIWALIAESERLRLFEKSNIDRWSECETSIVRLFLNSSAEAIQLELKRSGFIRGINSIRRYRRSLREDGFAPTYSVRELARLLGVGRQKIAIWIGLQWLLLPRESEGIEIGRVTIHLQDVLDFVLNFPSEFSLAKVDQEWFRSVVLANLVVKQNQNFDESALRSEMTAQRKPDNTVVVKSKGRSVNELVAGR